MDPKSCECGCGEVVREGSRFIKGHNTRSPEFQQKKIDAVKRSFAARRLRVSSIPQKQPDWLFDDIQTRSLALNYVQSGSISKEELMQIARVGLLKSLNLQKISNIENATTRITPVKHKKRAFNKYSIWLGSELKQLQCAHEIYKKLPSRGKKRKMLKELRKKFGRTTHSIRWQFNKFNQI